MRIFVTGATGFIGSHLISHLHAAGHAVSALARPGAKALPTWVHTVHGSLDSISQWQAQLRHVDALIHLAASYQIGPVDRQTMAHTNIVGTHQVLQAACREGVARIVHVSSTAALGETHGQLANEQHTHNGRFRSFYEQTKHVAHGIALELQAQGAPLCIAIPGGVFGPGDCSSLAQTLRTLMQGKLAAQLASDSQFQLCPVDVLCEGLRQMIERAELGQNYLLTGQAVTLQQVIAQLCRSHQLPTPKTMAPAKLAKLARCADALARLGMRTPLSTEALQIMDGSTYVYSSAKAQAALDWPWTQICADFWPALAHYAASLQQPA